MINKINNVYILFRVIRQYLCMLFIFKLNSASACQNESGVVIVVACPFKTPSFQLMFKAVSHESIVAIPEYIPESLFSSKTVPFGICIFLVMLCFVLINTRDITTAFCFCLSVEKPLYLLCVKLLNILGLFFLYNDVTLLNYNSAMQ